MSTQWEGRTMLLQDVKPLVRRLFDYVEKLRNNHHVLAIGSCVQVERSNIQVEVLGKTVCIDASLVET
jgi:hypothetical protein